MQSPLIYTLTVIVMGGKKPKPGTHKKRFFFIYNNANI